MLFVWFKDTNMHLLVAGLVLMSTMITARWASLVPCSIVSDIFEPSDSDIFEPSCVWTVLYLPAAVLVTRVSNN